MMTRKLTLVFLICLLSRLAGAQTALRLDEALTLALKNNPAMASASLEVEHQQSLKRASLEIPKTNFLVIYGQYNSIARNDNNITINQSLPFPTQLVSQHSLGKSLVKGSELKKSVTGHELILRVKSTYNQLLFLKARHELLIRQDSLYGELLNSSTLRFKAGESTLLEKTSSETQAYEVRNTLQKNTADISIYQNQLQLFVNAQTPIDVIGPFEEKVFVLHIDSAELAQNPMLTYQQQQIEIAEKQKKVEVSKALPDFTVGYFNQTLIGYQTVDGEEQYFNSADRFQGIQAGFSIPIWFTPHTARIKAASISNQLAKTKLESFEFSLRGQYQQALQEYTKNKNSVEYYKKYALANAELLIRQSRSAYKNGELDYTAYLINLKNATTIHENYLLALSQLNESIIQLEFLTGKK